MTVQEAGDDVNLGPGLRTGKVERVGQSCIGVRFDST
jgi:hypothetical protein